MGVRNLPTDTDSDEPYPDDKGIKDMEFIFGSHFGINNLEWDKLSKRKKK